MSHHLFQNLDPQNIYTTKDSAQTMLGFFNFNKKFRQASFLPSFTKYKKPLYLCTICGVYFKMNHHLQAHLTTHSSEKPHQCNVCKKRFSKKDTMKRHSYTHTGLRKNACNICGKRFIQRCNLVLHQRTHSKAKPHSCLYCKKNFSSQSRLKIHLRIHTNSYPYHCSVCWKTFTQSSDLKRHQLTHSSKVFSCLKCTRTYKHQRNLEKHSKKHHQTNESPEKNQQINDILTSQVCDILTNPQKVIAASTPHNQHPITDISADTIVTINMSDFNSTTLCEEVSYENVQKDINQYRYTINSWT